MDQSNYKTMSLICPSCGGKMELKDNGERAECPYCGHVMLIDKEDPSQKAYELHMAKARAEEDIRDLQEKKQRRRKLKGWLIALCVIAVLLLINIFIPGSPMRDLVFPQTVDPFAAVKVSFTGMSGAGKVELELSNHDAAAYYDTDYFEISPKTGLSNGDRVTVKAKAPAGWRFEPSEKQYTVEGLSEWVLRTEQLEGTNLDAIHANTERLIREDWEEILSSSFAQEMTITPYRIYLFISDDESSYYERNVLYDTYEVNVTRDDGSIFTSYEACRYADLKIPKDGVLVADYGSLMGFNLGYSYGFSYTHSFSGWTDPSEMEADLRYARDGYHLVE